MSKAKPVTRNSLLRSIASQAYNIDVSRAHIYNDKVVAGRSLKVASFAITSQSTENKELGFARFACLAFEAFGDRFISATNERSYGPAIIIAPRKLSAEQKKWLALFGNLKDYCTPWERRRLAAADKRRHALESK